MSKQGESTWPWRWWCQMVRCKLPSESTWRLLQAGGFAAPWWYETSCTRCGKRALIDRHKPIDGARCASQVKRWGYYCELPAQHTGLHMCGNAAWLDGDTKARTLDDDDDERLHHLRCLSVMLRWYGDDAYAVTIEAEWDKLRASLLEKHERR